MSTYSTPLQAQRSGQSSHWLEQQLARLHDLTAEYRQLRQDTRADADQSKRANRGKLDAAIENMLQDMASREGITACMVSYDGLLMSQAGTLPDFEALAAVSAECFRGTDRGAQAMALGRVDQMVVVGEDHKLALFRVGALVLGILSPRETVLGVVLS